MYFIEMQFAFSISGKPAHRPVHPVTRITWYRYAVRWWWFRTGRFSLKFYINANGYVTIGRKKIKLTVSKQRKLPGKAGWVWFRWGNYYIYLRFDRRVMWVWLFTVNGACKKSWGGMKHFCGKSKAGKPRANKPGGKYVRENLLSVFYYEAFC